MKQAAIADDAFYKKFS